MAVIKCKMCGGDLKLEEGSTVCECEYCGTRQTVPSADNEKKLTLFSRAGRLLRGCEFDKAAGVFETIVADFPEEAEAYWGLVLCKYGIEYVDDPATGKKIPTCHRSSFDCVLDDPNFEQACENTDAVARRVYRDEARQIEELRQAILQVSGREEPYDVFISYKETDRNGERTLDSVIAQDIYTALTEKGLRVFFSRISLEDKLGTEYEPYIFAALNSAKVMLAVGTDYENFDSVWVKNEWSRFLKLIASGQKKTLIPVFKNMDAYDMPREFAKLAAQDMGKVGAMQDLVRGVEKLLGKKETASANAPGVQADPALSAVSAQTAAMLKRGFMMLGDGDYAKADDFFERVLNNDAECAQAYWGKALAQAKVPNAEKYGSVALFQKLRSQEKASDVTVEAIRIAALARQADDTGLLEDFRDEELEELLADIDCTPVRFRDALPYYERQEEVFRDTAALHTLIRNPDFDRAAQYADAPFREAEQTALKSLRAAIASAIEAEKKKRAEARNRSGNKKAQVISTVKARLSAARQEQASGRKAIEAARQEAEAKAEAAYREAAAGFERDHQLAVTARENEYRLAVTEWQRKKADYDQHHALAVETRRNLEERIARQQTELINLTGLFTGRKRKELESNLSLLREKLGQTVIPEDPGPEPPRPAPLQKGTPPRKEDFLKATGEDLSGKLRETIKCGLSPAYNEKRKELEKKRKELEKLREEKRKELEKLRNAKPGDEIRFGSYPTGADRKKELIPWLVLARETDRILVISKYALDCQRYNTEFTTVTWETCTLWKWLNETFVNKAFSAEERGKIPKVTVNADKNPRYSTSPGNNTEDQVFLLSIPEVKQYFSTDTARQLLLHQPADQPDLAINRW